MKMNGKKVHGDYIVMCPCCGTHYAIDSGIVEDVIRGNRTEVFCPYCEGKAIFRNRKDITDILVTTKFVVEG